MGLKNEFFADFWGYYPFFAKKSDFSLDGLKIEFLADLEGF